MPEDFSRIRDWVEPAHPGVIKLHEELVAIYRKIREVYQQRIDQAFDRVSRQIGFVVTTTVPVDLQFGPDGKLIKASVAEGLQGTLFEKELEAALNPQPLPPGPDPWKVSAGTYRIQVIWYAGLKLKLRTDWMEPAHVGREKLLAFVRPGFARLKPEVMEPVHWFDPASVLPVEEGVLIHAIDEVYPDLKLLERVVAARQALRKVIPDVREPAHLTPEVREPAHLTPGGLTASPQATAVNPALIRPEVREPAHTPALPAETATEILRQIAEVLRRSGL